MLTPEENALLTEVGPGTPCGALLRRYWQPVCYVGELTAAEPRKAVKVMGEELVVFRLPDGDLRMAGTIDGDDFDDGHATLPIRGGSGEFRGADGKTVFRPTGGQHRSGTDLLARAGSTTQAVRLSRARRASRSRGATRSGSPR